MYTIFLDGEAIATRQAEGLSVIDPVLTLEVNKAGTLVFTMLPDHPKYNSIILRQSMITVEMDGEEVFEGIPVSESTDFFKRKTISCEGSLTFLNDTIQRQAVYRNQTVSSLLGAYLANHNAQADAGHQFTLGVVTVDGGNTIYRYTNYNNTMTEIGEDLIDNYGGYLRVRKASGVRYLDYLESSPRTSTQVISLGRNLLDLSSNLTSEDICTVLIPLGTRLEEQVVEGLDKRLTIESVNNGDDYIVGSAASIYGNVWKTAVWDDVTVPSVLLTKGQNYLNDAQYANLVIEATALDLGLTGEEVEQFRILDMVRVKSDPHGLDRYFMLTKLAISLNHPGDTQITLGKDEKLSISARSANLSTEVETLPTSIQITAAENAKAILDLASSGHIYMVTDNDGVWTELLIMDTNDINTAQKIWRWNLNGWGYSDDGGQTYRLAATMNGAIVADFITAGMLASPNGDYSLNMNTGAVTMASANITGGQIALVASSDANNKIDISYGDYKTFISPRYINARLKLSGIDYTAALSGNALSFWDTSNIAARIELVSTPTPDLVFYDITGNKNGTGYISKVDVSGTTNAYGNLAIPSLDPTSETIISAFATSSDNVTNYCMPFDANGSWYITLKDRSGNLMANKAVVATCFYCRLAR